jgi:hypothetical protein
MTYASEPIVTVAITCARMSILLFYARIFTTRNFRISVYIVHAFNLSWGIAFTFLYIFQCRPVEPFWTQQQGKRVGCVDIAINDYYAVAAIIIDVMVLALPWPIVWKLNMRTTQKVAVLSIFGLGAMYVSHILSFVISFV